MFEDVGKKLKGFAAFYSICTLVAAVFGFIGIFVLADNLRLSGWELVLMLVGFALVVVVMLGTCWAICAFGEVTESTQWIERKLNDANETLTETKDLLRKALAVPMTEAEQKEADWEKQARIRKELDEMKTEAFRAFRAKAEK